MTALSQTAKTNRIRDLNDAFRRTFAGGTMTAGVDALPDMVKAAALQKAATFDEFNEDNDPTASTTSEASSSAVASSFGRLSTTTVRWSTAARTRATPSKPPAS